LCEGKGVDKFRADLKTGHIEVIIFNNLSTKDWFDKHGPCEGHIIYLWNSEYEGDIQFISDTTGMTHTIDPAKYSIILRDPRGESIVDKILSHEMLAEHFARGFFGLPSNFFKHKPYSIRTNYFKTHENTKEADDDTFWCACDGRRDGSLTFRRVSKSEVKNSEQALKFKVVVPKALGSKGIKKIEGVLKFVSCAGTSNIYVLYPNEICTETYILIYMCDTLEEAQNFRYYMHSPLVQYIISMRCATQHICEGLKWIPKMPHYNKRWTDEEIYSEFDLTPEEIDLIEVMTSILMIRHQRYLVSETVRHYAV
jgi:site-specific DNA-methyltransferase (adenine-specific)